MPVFGALRDSTATHRVVLIASAVGVLLAILSVVLVVSTSPGRRRSAVDGISAALAPLPIAQRDLYPPEEPDFLPPFIPSRPPVADWRAAAADLWVPISSQDLAPLREASDAAIAALLERTP